MYELSEDQITAVTALTELYKQDLADAKEKKDIGKIEDADNWLNRLERAIKYYTETGKLKEVDNRDYKIGFSRARRAKLADKDAAWPFSISATQHTATAPAPKPANIDALITGLKQKQSAKTPDLAQQLEEEKAKNASLIDELSSLRELMVAITGEIDKLLGAA